MTDSAGFWIALGRDCLDAARRLPESEARLGWPRAQLLGLALECQLKAYIRATRNGAPDSHDLARLLTLARHCGLRMSAEDDAALAAIDRIRRRPPDGAGDDFTVPTTDAIETLVQTIGRQLP